MARYIDADKIQFYRDSEGDTTIEYAYKSDIDDIPAADVRPERHGRWIKDGDVLVCSECGEEHAWEDYRATYCEDCGAKMDLENPIGSNARIVNTGTCEKPYYQIEYQDNNDGALHLGYGTKDLVIAIHWLSRYFGGGAKMDGKNG